MKIVIIFNELTDYRRIDKFEEKESTCTYMATS